MENMPKKPIRIADYRNNKSIRKEKYKNKKKENKKIYC